MKSARLNPAATWLMPRARRGLILALTGLIGLAVVMAMPARADDVAFVRYLLVGDQVQVETDGPATTQATPFAIASVGKTMTAVAVLRLVDRGALRLDDPVAPLVPPQVVDGLGGMTGITLGHLLSMTSGLPDYLGDDYIDAVADRPGAMRGPFDAVRFAYGLPPLFPPGADFDYSNTNYVLLGAILESATGLSYAEVMAREVLGPVGMTDTFVFGTRPVPPGFAQGVEDGVSIGDYYTAQGLGDGGLISTAADVALFYRALFVERSLLTMDGMRALLSDPVGAGYGMGIEIGGGGWFTGHSGGDIGFVSDARIDLATGRIAVELIADGYAEADWPAEVLRTAP